MKNLAGVETADTYIRDELQHAGVPIEKVPKGRSEVPYTLIGKISGKKGGEFTFHRAWYYWVVSGRVPMSVAKKLYRNEVGKKDVRVAGHCGCPPPDERRKLGSLIWAYPSNPAPLFPIDWYMKSRFFQSAQNFVDWIRSLWPFTRWYIDSYHIDSQAGLDLFVKALRENGLV